MQCIHGSDAMTHAPASIARPSVVARAGKLFASRDLCHTRCIRSIVQLSHRELDSRLRSRVGVGFLMSPLKISFAGIESVLNGNADVRHRGKRLNCEDSLAGAIQKIISGQCVSFKLRKRARWDCLSFRHPRSHRRVLVEVKNENVLR